MYCAGGAGHGVRRSDVGYFIVHGLFQRATMVASVGIRFGWDSDVDGVSGLAELRLTQLPCPDTLCPGGWIGCGGRHCAPAVGIRPVSPEIFFIDGDLWCVFHCAGVSALVVSVLADGAVGVCGDRRTLGFARAATWFSALFVLKRDRCLS